MLIESSRLTSVLGNWEVNGYRGLSVAGTIEYVAKWMLKELSNLLEKIYIKWDGDDGVSNVFLGS